MSPSGSYERRRDNACPHPGCDWRGNLVKSHHNNMGSHTGPNARPDDCLLCEAVQAAQLLLKASRR
jgi:hypothetical protein